MQPPHAETSVFIPRFDDFHQQPAQRMAEKDGVADLRTKQPFLRPHQQIIAAAVFRLHAPAGDAHNFERQPVRFGLFQDRVDGLQ